MESSTEKLLRLSMFDGEHKKFQIWWTRFMAYAGVLGSVKPLRKVEKLKCH
jgi:hypothetical protein